MNVSARWHRFTEKKGRLLTLILLLGLGLRLSNLDAASLWIDEIYSLIVSNTHRFPERLDGVIHPARYFYEQYLSWQPMQWDRLFDLLKINVHMPLYYLLVNPWMGLFGNHTLGLRSFSALCSALMILPVFALGNAMAGKRAGWLGAFVAAVLPFQIYYGQEGRMYALSLLWTALAGFTFWKLLFSEKRLAWSLLYAVAVSGGILSHYMFVFFLGFQGMFGLFWLFRTQNWRQMVFWIPALLALGGIGLAWMPIYQLQQQGVNEEYHFAKGLLSWSRYLSVPFWQPLVVIAGDNRLERAFYFPLTLFLGIASLIGRVKARVQKTITLQREGYLIAWVVLPLLLQIAYDVMKHTHVSVIERYAMLISPALCVALGLALSQWLAPHASPRRRSAGFLILGMMTVMAVATVAAPSPFRDEHNKDKNIRRKIGYFVENARPQDLVFVNGPWGAPNLAAYYLNASRPQQPVLYWIKDFRGQAVPLPSKTLFKPYQRVWLFRDRANNERGLQTAKNYLQSVYPHWTQSHDWFIYTRS